MTKRVILLYNNIVGLHLALNLCHSCSWQFFDFFFILMLSRIANFFLWKYAVIRFLLIKFTNNNYFCTL